MTIPDTAAEDKQRLYERLFVAAEDLGFARQYAQHLLRKGWHSAPWERRGSRFASAYRYMWCPVSSFHERRM